MDLRVSKLGITLNDGIVCGAASFLRSLYFYPVSVHVLLFLFYPHLLSTNSQDRKIATTSFLDASFMKTLASAIRFGTPLLVQVLQQSAS